MAVTRYDLKNVCAEVDRVNALLRAGLREHNPIHELWQSTCKDLERVITADTYSPMSKFYLTEKLGITKNFEFSHINLIDSAAEHYGYSRTDEVYCVRQFEAHRETIEQMWRGPVIIEPHPWVAGGVSIRPAPPPPAPIVIPPTIPLSGILPNQVILGTDVFTGQVAVDHVQTLPHLLIAGTSGFGKSVFLHQLIVQLLAAEPDQVAEVALVDLKGGVEFNSYRRRSNRVSVVWEYEDVVAKVDDLVALMLERQRTMVARSWRLYPGQRVFFIVDEFAQIQLYPRQGKEEKAEHDRLIANLNRLSMLGRAVGIVLVAAIQKPTTDVMDSSFRMNLQGQVCFRVPNRLMASTMFGSVDELALDPVRLPRGRFIYYDAMAGVTRYLQAHVAAET